MKLGILCTIINGFGRRGYYNSQETGLALALADAGHEVVIYKGINPQLSRTEEEVYPKVKLVSVPMRHAGAHGMCPPGVIDPSLDGLLCFADTQIFLPLVYRFCRANDIVFVPYVGVTASFSGGLRGRIMNSLFAAGLLRIYRKIPVLAKTPEEEQELHRLGVCDVTVAPVGMNFSLMKQDFAATDRRAVRRKYGYSDDDKVIIFVGKMQRVKRAPEMVGLFGRLLKEEEKKSGTGPDGTDVSDGKETSRWRLLMVGEGPERHLVDEKIRDLHAGDLVKVIDKVPFDDMWEIYRTGDFFVNLSREEIFGMAVLEAAYYHVAVGAMSAPGPSYTLSGRRVHRVFDSEDDLINWLMEEKPSEEDLAADARDMSEMFSWNNTAGKFAGIVLKSGRDNTCAFSGDDTHSREPEAEEAGPDRPDEGGRITRVIINADDFGQSKSCTLAIYDAWKRGLITDTTMVANGGAMKTALDIIRGDSAFAAHIGIHLNITEGRTVTKSYRLCGRLAEGDHFSDVLKKRSSDLRLLSGKERGAVSRELDAQIERLERAGIVLTHADSHHHIHTRPQICGLFMRALQRHGIHRVRAAKNQENLAGWKRKLIALYNRQLVKKGFVTTDFMGSAAEYICLHEGTNEIMVHPDYDAEGRLIDRREKEPLPGGAYEARGPLLEDALRIVPDDAVRISWRDM